MTQAVLKNEVTDLKPESLLDTRARREVAETTSDLLADAYRLLINTQGLHWNVEGPMFYSLHKLTEDQYKELSDAVDEIAERIRALGLPAPQSIREFDERSIVDDLPTSGDLQLRIERLISDYERSVARATLVAQRAEEVGDIRTAELLTGRIGVYEHNAWMLRATIAS